MNWSGECLKLHIEGASHAPAVGMCLEGIPAGERIDPETLQRFLDRRAPGRTPWSSPRKEPDRPVFRSGLRDGETDGGPIAAHIANRDVKSGDYARLSAVPRPGHADYPAAVKYGEGYDAAGGGAFSGRMTAPLCVAGGICLQLLERRGIRVISRIAEIGGVRDVGELLETTAEKRFPVVDDAAGEAMIAAIMEAKAQGDSMGGVVECQVLGLPVGLGGPLFQGLESRIGALVYGIPAVKGLDFGAGFASARLRGSENNDAFLLREGRIITESNRCGGLLGGMTDGMPLVFRAAFKPTPSIAKPQRSVDLRTRQETELRLTGRHDPCVVPRAVPAVEAAAAIAVLDALLERQEAKAPEELADYRAWLDRLDDQIAGLLTRRMELSGQIGTYKMARGLPIRDEDREQEKLASVEETCPEALRGELRAVYGEILRQSRGLQVRRSPELRCGLLGRKLGHSYSPQIHGLLGDYGYRLFEREPEELADFLRQGDWQGLNVTIPYKKTVLPFCASLSDAAREIGSVNTLLRRPDGSLFGDNTDAFGFARLLRESGIDPAGKKALVLGSGGASVMACWVLRQQGAREVTVISRGGEDNYGNLDRHADAQLIVNTTPVGMYPHNGQAPVDLRAFPACCGVVDVIYNPARTALLLQAEALGIPYAGGLGMLVAQAKRSAELFTASAIPDCRIGEITRRLSREMENIVLIGMPGSGKSSLARILGERLGRPVLDADAEIEKQAGKTIPDIFAEEGEAGFRRRETAVLRELGKRSGCVISTGGGCVTREENYPLLHQNGVIFWRKRAVELLSREGRPISLSRDLEELCAQREPLYARFADYVIEETETLEEAAEKILEVLA